LAKEVEALIRENETLAKEVEALTREHEALLSEYKALPSEKIASLCELAKQSGQFELLQQSLQQAGIEVPNI
jgi:FtsZ-binding cell division protein ZapB